MNVGSLAFLYPGQGSQVPGMLHDLPEYPAVKLTLDAAAAIAGDIDELDSVVALRSSSNSQLALLICGVATTQAFAEDLDIRPEIVAGHSVGAFAAAVAAGVLTFREALDAVRLRGQLMDQACASGQWGMAAITGLRLRQVRNLLGTLDIDSDHLWIANINSDDQIVIAGTAAGLSSAGQAARRAGARQFQPLDVDIASHGPLQRKTASALAAHLAEIPLRTQSAAYFTNTGARRILNDARLVLDDLAQSVAQPVHWYDIARLLPEFGVTVAVQMPPGHVLSRLAHTAAPQLATLSPADEGVPRTVARLGR